jgi:ubiquinone/menaquinone biosynthesis C-methylase UbiE
MNYEEAVEWLRAQPQHSELVRLSYLDEDVLGAARRFAESEEAREVAKRLGLRNSRKLTIADIGCGNGIAAFAMAQYGHKVIAVDPDPSEKVGLEACRKLAQMLTAGSIESFTGTAESIPLTNNSVDRIYTRQAMHHFRDLPGAVKECARVLKPGGLFFGTREHVISDEAEKVIFLRDHIMQPLHGGENAFRLEEYHDAFAKANLRLIASLGRIESVINYYPFTEAERVQELAEHARNKKGAVVEWLTRNVGMVQRKVAKHLAAFDRYPGRLNSFLAIKEG